MSIVLAVIAFVIPVAAIGYGILCYKVGVKAANAKLEAELKLVAETPVGKSVIEVQVLIDRLRVNVLKLASTIEADVKKEIAKV
jgi:hypothetical protein